MSRRICSILALLLSFLFPKLVTAASHELSERLEALRSNRRQILDSLIVPIEACVRRQDTGHIAFHGCIDWHSSVHGTWALVKYTGLTRDKRFDPLVQGIILTPAKIEAEWRFLRGHPEFEMPYGRAWFLRLALDHRSAFNSDRLVGMGDYVVESLMDYFRRSPPDPFSREYNNASWALINLYDYGVSRQDRTVTAFVDELVRKYFVPINQPCPVQNEEYSWPDFMPVCTGWAYLVALANPSANLQDWLKKFFPTDVAITPIARPRNAHHMGMNFSRSWGFWRLFKATKDPVYLKLYLDHFELQYNNPSWWKGDYRAVGHWVAQFGVFALAPVFLE